MLLRHGLKSPSGLTKIRREKSGVPKPKLLHPLHPPSESISCLNSPSTGTVGYMQIPKILHSHTIAHQPSNKRQKNPVVAKRPEAHSLTLAEAFPDEFHEATA